MVTTLEDIKRLPIGERFADCKALQNLIISKVAKANRCVP